MKQEQRLRNLLFRIRTVRCIHCLTIKAKRYFYIFIPGIIHQAAQSRPAGTPKEDRRLKKGVVILGVSKDSVASHKRFEEKQDLTITLLSDAELEVIKAYDVWHEKKMCGKVSMGVVRTTYLIDEKGIIIKANDKVKAADDPEKMLEEI